MEANEERMEKMKEIISEQLMVDEEELIENASFAEDLGADSLDMVEMVMELEDEFGIEIPDEDAEDLTTVGDAKEYLQDML